MPFIRSYDGTRSLGELTPMNYFWGVVSVASGAASAYHGYKRNNSIGSAVLWGVLGSIFPVITPAIAAAQGFGERRKA